MCLQKDWPEIVSVLYQVRNEEPVKVVSNLTCVKVSLASVGDLLDRSFFLPACVFNLLGTVGCGLQDGGRLPEIAHSILC